MLFHFKKTSIWKKGSLPLFLSLFHQRHSLFQWLQMGSYLLKRDSILIKFYPLHPLPRPRLYLGYMLQISKKIMSHLILFDLFCIDPAYELSLN